MPELTCETFERLFKAINSRVAHNYEFCEESRLGECVEVTNLSCRVLYPALGVIFKDKRINRIDYDYAKKFWQFMISGGTDAKEAFKEYPNVAKFLSKPKSDTLPENFNTFYGPRIVAQLPVIISELKNNPESRRAVIQILQEKDQALLELDESLEYPCTDSMAYYIRDGLLHAHVHMRSQNTATVLQLDMYLQYKLMEHIANLLNLKLGHFNLTMVSAHIYQRDYDYVHNFLQGY